MQSNALSFHQMTTERLPVHIAAKTSTESRIVSNVAGGVVNQGQRGQPYYGHSLRNEKSADANFSKATAQAAYTNQANVINLRQTRHQLDSLVPLGHTQDQQIGNV